MSNAYSYGPGGAQQGGYGGQQQSYGSAPPQQGGYGAPPPQQGGYGGGGYGQAPPPAQGGGYPPQGGGYPPQGGRPQTYSQSSGPPPGADPQLWGFFIAVDADKSGNISAHELQAALVNGDWSPFEIDTVRMLMSIFDVSRDGTISFNEFVGLWKYIGDWQKTFKHFDSDRSGNIDQQELGNALRAFGYNLNPQLLHLITAKYVVVNDAKTQTGSLPNSRGASQGITFDRFVRACVVIKSLTESFQKFDTQRQGWAQLSYDQFMGACLSAP